jgi:archaellum component FlaC
MVNSIEVVGIRRKLKEKIRSLGVTIENSGYEIEKIGSFIRDVSNKVGSIDEATIITNVLLAIGDTKEEIKTIRKAISDYRRYIKGGG